MYEENVSIRLLRRFLLSVDFLVDDFAADLDGVFATIMDKYSLALVFSSYLVKTEADSEVNLLELNVEKISGFCKTQRREKIPSHSNA